MNSNAQDLELKFNFLRDHCTSQVFFVGVEGYCNMSKILDILLSSQVRIKQEFDLLTQRINEINIVFVSKDLVFIFDGYTDLINNKSLCLFNNSTHKFDSHLLIE